MASVGSTDWEVVTAGEISASDHFRALSFLHLARYTNICMARCKLTRSNYFESTGLSTKDKLCIDVCLHELKRAASIEQDYKAFVEEMFKAQRQR